MRSFLMVAILATAARLSAAPTEFVPMQSTEPCNKCQGVLLPGERVPSHETSWTVHCDLPEFFLTEGVLYTTAPVLPPFNLKDGSPLSEEMRTQVNQGFESIDDDFEVFFFHTTDPPKGSGGRRIAVHVFNEGTEPVVLRPRQAITSEGLIGAVHDMENNLARKVMAGDWDVPLGTVTVAAGTGAVIAHGKRFGAEANGADSSTNKNCFGVVQAAVEGGEAAKLRVSVVAIPSTEPTGIGAAVDKFLTVGANSGEGVIDLASRPSGCQVRRSTGVFESFSWQSAPVVIDAASLGSTPLMFQMAVPEVQSAGCPDLQQTAPLALHPPASRPDTVGNYMNEYLVFMELTNSSAEPAAVDLRFGKSDADVGLAWQLATGSAAPSAEELRGLPVKAGWAGPKQTSDRADDTRSLLEGAPLVVAPGESVRVGLRFMIVGNASLPFQLHVTGAGES